MAACCLLLFWLQSNSTPPNGWFSQRDQSGINNLNCDSRMPACMDGQMPSGLQAATSAALQTIDMDTLYAGHNRHHVGLKHVATQLSTHRSNCTSRHSEHYTYRVFNSVHAAEPTGQPY